MLLNVIADMVGSWWPALIFQTSHVISKVCNVFLSVLAELKTYTLKIYTIFKSGAYPLFLKIAFVL